MPIAGLTNTPAAFMKIGKIAKGDRGGTNGAPRDLDHFRIVFKESELSKLLDAKFLEVYGKTPRAINIRFAANNPIEVWDANYECYRAGALMAKAGSNENGLYWIYYRDPETNEVWIRNGQAVTSAGREFMMKPILLEEPVYRSKKDEPYYLQAYGRLQCVIPELTRLDTPSGPRAVVGFMEFTPHSPIDIRNISAELDMYNNLARAAGKSISGIPFQLIRRQEEHMVKIEGKMAKKKFWVVHLDCAGVWGQLAFEAVERLALPETINYEDVIDADDFEEPTPEQQPQPAPKPQPAPSVQEPIRDEPEITMDFNTAKQTLIVVTKKNGQNIQKFAGELNDTQLKWVIENDKDPIAVKAAKVVQADRAEDAKKEKVKA